LLGRRPEERVVRLLPRAPTPSSTVALARALAEALTDRRAAAAPEWTSTDRRVARGPIPSPNLDAHGKTATGSRTASAASVAAA
ncbi:MAG: hypothetical protein M3O36_17210, partial [Myxococcota bacterium]|nr:hypothetical protein [Myxococcota bacterium]